jgi:hypothetical protein
MLKKLTKRDARRNGSPLICDIIWLGYFAMGDDEWRNIIKDFVTWNNI